MNNQEYLAETRPIDHDNTVDCGIMECLRLAMGKSFITFAGAGSGKTYSLKRALDYLKEAHEATFLLKGKEIAVVTFTNNAADEIIDRVGRNPIFSISTIHSFCWMNIAGFDEDIRKWYLSVIPLELADLEDKERRGRAGAASDARKQRIARLAEKIEWLSEARTFIYDPNGVNSSNNSLSHTDVLKIFAHFLELKPMMAEIIVNKYPFIFVDESQDTDKGVISALFALQKTHSDRVVIGLFGDTMQRIFGGGDPALGVTVPNNWLPFDKKMNHRSARRIVGLGNIIRSEDDGRTQFARDGASEGFIRYFLLPHGTSKKDEVEQGIRAKMADITGDIGWINIKDDETAILLLEHRMVSQRLGFHVLVDELARSSKVRSLIFDGDNAELNYFSNIVLPLADAGLNGSDFEVLSILRLHKSPLLEENVFAANLTDPLLPARLAEKALREVVSKESVTFLDVLKVIAEHGLLPIPTKLQAFVAQRRDLKGDIDELSRTQSPVENVTMVINTIGELEDDEIGAWTGALSTEFWQIRNYRKYIEDESIYRTHQGVKGNEFERVMVIMDDEEAGGFLFSYEQFFGAKELSASMLEKVRAGEETGLDRTRRLFYVTSTRAKSSLAHVIYTADVEKVRNSLVERRFATDEEIFVCD